MNEALVRERSVVVQIIVIKTHFIICVTTANLKHFFKMLDEREQLNRSVKQVE